MPTQESPRPLYRSRKGFFLGVCRGVSNYTGIPLAYIQAFFIVLCLSTGLMPGLILYIAAAILMKPEPIVPLTSPEQAEFYNSYVHSRSLALQRLKGSFENIERRIQRIESIVTAREFSWEDRLNNGR